VTDDSTLVVADEERELAELLEIPWVRDRVTRACEGSQCSVGAAREILAVFAEDGPLEAADRGSGEPVDGRSAESPFRSCRRTGYSSAPANGRTRCPRMSARS